MCGTFWRPTSPVRVSQNRGGKRRLDGAREGFSGSLFALVGCGVGSLFAGLWPGRMCGKQ